jgi:hypothetical protein
MGLPRPEVEKILGHPELATADSLVYSRQFKRKTTLREFEMLRSSYPKSLSDQEAHEQFDSHPVEQYLLARFVDSKLVYLAVSISGGLD